MAWRIFGMAASQRGEARFPCLQKPLSTSTTMVTLGMVRSPAPTAGSGGDDGPPWRGARVRAVTPPRLGAGPALDHHDVGREVIGPLEKGAADPIRVDRDLLALEALDLVDIEAAAGNDLDVLEALPVESAADQVAELR